MSIESLFKNNPTEAELEYLMQRKAEQKGQSMVHVFLNEFITEGKAGIEIVGKKLKERGIEFTRDGRTSSPILYTEQKSIDLNHAGILFGLSGIAVESTLVEQVFDANDFCGLYEESLRGTPLPPFFQKANDGIERLTKDHWRRMITLANRDKTLAVFFEPEGFDALPVNLQAVLHGIKLLPVIQQHILPEYRIRASSLVAPQSLAN